MSSMERVGMNRSGIERRNRLVHALQELYPQGIVVLISAQYEQPRMRFFQDSMFLYLTGLDMLPGAVLAIVLQSTSVETILYHPAYVADRSVWVGAEASAGVEDLCVRELGDPYAGYSAHPFFSYAEHKELLALLKASIDSGSVIGVCSLGKGDSVQRRNYERWASYIPELNKQAVDITPVLARLRRMKDADEIGSVERAIAITHQALRDAQQCITPGALEAEVYGALIAAMVRAGAREAFPSIVAAGRNSTILHYERNDGTLAPGDGIVIDCGASWNGYAADISRTFPVSGSFTARQQQIYDCVYEVQHQVRAAVRPGMWLHNARYPDQSLHHIALQAFTRYGMERYFLHSIGHFLGLDVHDVGDTQEPLRPGDLITIEPGLYIRDESFGVRIEDDILVTESGSSCLSSPR